MLDAPLSDLVYLVYKVYRIERDGTNKNFVSRTQRAMDKGNLHLAGRPPREDKVARVLEEKEHQRSDG